MAEGFEPCHVPQKSRRDKLRVGAGGGVELVSAGFHGFLSPYDHSLLPSELLSCSAAAGSDQCLLNHRFHPLAAAEEGGGCKSYSVGSVVKEEGGFRSLIPPSSFLSTHNHHQVSGLDQLPQVAVNPSCSSSIHGSGSSSPFLYAPQTLQNLRDLAHSYNNALSLSLSSHDNNVDSNNRTVDNVAPLELNLQRYGSSATEGLLIPTAISAGGGLTSNEVSRSSVPHGSSAGYSSILKASKFLRPTQQLLEELCDVGRPETVEKIAEADSSLVVDASTIERYLRVEDGSGSVSSCGGDEGEVLRKKSRLISMLEEVCFNFIWFLRTC